MNFYSLCFVFDETKDCVLLIQKNRPNWQAGFLNGIGGKFEDDENWESCTIREVWEECDIKLTPDELVYVGRYDSSKYCVFISAASIDDERFISHKQKTDETLHVIDVGSLIQYEREGILLKSALLSIVASIQRIDNFTGIQQMVVYYEDGKH